MLHRVGRLAGRRSLPQDRIAFWSTESAASRIDCVAPDGHVTEILLTADGARRSGSPCLVSHGGVEAEVFGEAEGMLGDEPLGVGQKPGSGSRRR